MHRNLLQSLLPLPAILLAGSAVGQQPAPPTASQVPSQATGSEPTAPVPPGATPAPSQAATAAPTTSAAATAPAPATVSAPTPGAILAGAQPGEWVAPALDDLLVMDLKGRRRVVIALAPGFAPVHVANIRALARAHWYDELWIERVQDNYVVQWGDPAGQKPLPPGVVALPPAEYERPASGVALTPLPYRDTFAERVGFADGMPVAAEGGQAWLAHCYGMVGVGRNNTPDTGHGGELYAVIGQAPRALDRNIALVGRVLVGMDTLAALPRGTEAMGFYKTEAERLPIASARLASDLPPAERPDVRILDARGPTFAAWAKARANRQDAFFVRPAGAVDLCNALPPVKTGG